jgi:hypothetical protein
MVNKAKYILVAAIMGSLFLIMYMTGQTSTNQTGYSSLMISMSNNFMPLIFLAVLVVVILGIAITNKSKGD